MLKKLNLPQPSRFALRKGLPVAIAAALAAEAEAEAEVEVVKVAWPDTE